MESIKDKDKIDSTNNGKHENQNGIKNDEVNEVIKHLLHNFDEWADLRMKLDELNNSPEQADDDDGVHILKLEINVLEDVVDLSELVLFYTDSFHIDVNNNVFLCPSDIEEGNSKQDHICKQADCREGIRSTNFGQEDHLQDLAEEVHQVEEAQHLNQQKSIRHGLNTL